jgi:hypothetical protein
MPMFLDIPAQYLCVRRDGTTEWVPGRLLTEPHDLKLLREVEWRFPRSMALPCNSLPDYPVEKYSDEFNWVSDDELDLDYAVEWHQRFGS